MADLGDLTTFLKTGSVPNLDWLDVDEEEYRRLDTLPKQNLDVRPDLEALWSHEDKPATAYVPNRESQPKTMGDLGREHGLLRAKPEDIRRVVRLAVIQTTDPVRIASELQRRFPQEDLREDKTLIAETLSERGLLGRYYINAADFPRCSSGGSQEAAFVRKFAAEAPYVLAKPECEGCIHRQSGNLCSVFHKQIKIQVPYTEDLASKVEASQKSKGYQIDASTAPPRVRIQRAFLASLSVESPLTIKPRENVLRLLRPVEAVEKISPPVDLTPYRNKAKDAVSESLHLGRLTVVEAQQGYRLAASADSVEALELITAQALRLDLAGLAQREVSQKVANTLRREMLKGRSLDELKTTLHMAFSRDDLEVTKVTWSALLKEAGLYGVVYATAESFEDCHDGANLLATYNPSVRVVLASQKCEACTHNKAGKCLSYGKPLVLSADDVLTAGMVASVVADHVRSGRLASVGSPIDWGSDPREALQEIYQVTASARAVSNRASIQRAFHGMPSTPMTTSGTKREIIKTAARLLNEGLYGADLLASLKAQFEVRDLTAAKEELKVVLADQGLQGTYFIDPTVYDDYGRGCKQASVKYRTGLVPFVKAGSKCVTCVHQVSVGTCSVLNKPLVAEVPYPQDKRVIQRELLASGRSTEVRFENLVNDGTRSMLEYELQRRAVEVNIDPEIEVHPLDVEFGGRL